MEEEKIYAERPNKTAIKREMLVLRDLGTQLIASPNNWLEQLPLSDRLRQEVIKAKQFKKGALRRQLIFLEKLLREENSDLIHQQLDDLQSPHRKDTKEFHQLEEWRDSLIADDSHVLEKLLDQYATLDRQHIRQLTRNAQKEEKNKKPPKSSRALFRYLRESIE